MSKNRRLRQREQRREKRQIKAELLSQSKKHDTHTPLPRNINLVCSFEDHAIHETKRDIREGVIEGNRTPILKKALELHTNIQNRKKQNT